MSAEGRAADPKKGARAGGARAPAELGRLGGYELVRLVETRGLFGVFEAKDVELGRSVRVTSVAPNVAPRAELAARLERHARLLARLPGDAVLGFHAVVRDGERMGIVTEAPPPGSLRAIVKDARPVSLDEAVAIAIVVTRAVAKLHKIGVAHLGLAPENVYLTADGVARLGGLFDASLDGSAEDESTMPESNGPEAAYRAPEYAPGAPHALSSDVFSLGAILAELATGKEAHEGRASGGARLGRGAGAGPVDIPEASTALTQTVARALERQPPLRYEHAGRLADELETLLDDGVSPESVARAVVLRAGVHVGKDKPVPAHPVALSTVAVRLGVVSAAMLGVFALSTLSDDDARGPRASAAAASAEVKVLAHPWAEVSVDGDRVDTTPIGKPLRLSPGRHELVFTHPNAPEERRTIDVGAGQRSTVEVEMEIVRIEDAGVDASP